MTRTRGATARIVESIESRLWPLPVAAVLVAVALGLVIPRIDLQVDSDLPLGVDSVIFNGGAETARSVLSAIVGSLITATSLTFSLTVVALQLASSQASPRVLRMFARDRYVHATLAVFLGTFAYSLTVMRAIRDSTESSPEFVPRIGVTVGFSLTLISVVMLVLFLAHLAAQLRVETMLKEIHAETDRTIELIRREDELLQSWPGDTPHPALPRTVAAESSGFITSRDRSELMAVAAAHGIVIREARLVGDNVLEGTPVAHWWARDDASPDIDPAVIERKIRGAWALGYERTAAQDVHFGVQQIVDITVRALSAGINDPTTAVNALGHLGSLLRAILDLPAVPAAVAGDDGELVLVTATRTRTETVHDSLGPIRHHTGGDPAVIRRLLQLADDLATLCPDVEVRGALVAELEAVRRQLEGDDTDPASAEALGAVLTDTMQRLAPMR